MNEGWTDKLKEQLNEGCKVTGYLQVSKVAGNFHFAPGKSFQQHSVHGIGLQLCVGVGTDLALPQTASVFLPI